MALSENIFGVGTGVLLYLLTRFSGGWWFGSGSPSQIPTQEGRDLPLPIREGRYTPPPIRDVGVVIRFHEDPLDPPSISPEKATLDIYGKEPIVLTRQVGVDNWRNWLKEIASQAASNRQGKVIVVEEWERRYLPASMKDIIRKALLDAGVPEDDIYFRSTAALKHAEQQGTYWKVQ